MIPFSHTIDVAAGLLLTAFVAGLWQGAAFMLLASALLRLMPRASAGLRHALLLASFAAALLLPWVRFSGGHAAAATHALPVASWVASLVALVWAAAAGTRGLQLFFAWSHLRAVRSEAKPICIAGTVTFPAGRRHARLCTSPAVDSPTILGFWRPVLLLPESMAPMLSVDDLQRIALHECEHLRRRDDWVNLLLQLGLMLSPLNPALLWLNRRIGVQRELACDAAVVASTGQPIAYASCLTQLAEQRLQQRDHLRLALAAWERKSELAQRVHALLQQPARWTARQSGLASAAAATLLLATSVGLARAPRFVRIVSQPVPTDFAATGAAPVQGTPAARMALASAQDATPVHMVKAVFTIQPASTPQIVTRKKNARHRVVTARKPQVQTTAHTLAALPAHMLRTSATMLPRRHFGDEAPIRFVTADLSTPYVAVPVANGWLLFEL